MRQGPTLPPVLSSPDPGSSGPFLRKVLAGSILALAVCSAVASPAGATFAAGDSQRWALAAREPALTASAQRTTQRVFSPYNAEGQRVLPVRTYRAATSCGGSWVSGQRGPLRCFAGRFIYDPCWPDPTGEDEAFCVSSPDAGSGVLLRGAVSADDGYPIRPNRASWALKLMNGRMCQFVSGATGGRSGLRLNYVCDKGRYLFGAPNRSRRIWTIRSSRSPSGKGWVRAAIMTAWK